MPDLTVSKYGGTITIGVESTPTGNTTSYATLPTYTSRAGNVITVSANTEYDRSFTLSVTARTTTDPAYQGTASAVSAWTVNQAGDLGPAPDDKYVTIVFELTNSNWNARYPQVSIQVFGDDSGNGPSLISGPAYKVDHIWPLTVSGSVDDSTTVNVAITLRDTEQGGNYLYNYGMGTPTITGSTGVGSSGVEICNDDFTLGGVNNTFYLQLTNQGFD